MKINEFNLSLGKPAALFDTTHPDWAPTVNLGYGGQNVVSSERYDRQKRRKITKIEKETAHDASCETETQNSKEVEPFDSSVKENWEIDHIHALNAEVKELQHLVEKTTFGSPSFFDSDVKVSFYTGLPNLQVLHIVHDFAAKVLNPSCKGPMC